MKILPSALMIAVAGASPALASSSQWFETDGARVRLVTSGKADAEGRLTGVLEIALQRGWKTYWRDPGDAGVPPIIDVSASTNVDDATLDFPAPQRHDEGDYKWAGYDYPVGLPVTFTLTAADQPALIEADVFLGICETICIPVKTTLSLDPSSDADNPEDAAVVQAAIAALPSPAHADFGITVVSEPGAQTVVLEAALPGDPASAELYLAGEEGYTFTTPTKTIKDGKALFTSEVSLPARTGTGPGLRYTLVTDSGAVSGLLPYF